MVQYHRLYIRNYIKTGSLIKKYLNEIMEELTLRLQFVFDLEYMVDKNKIKIKVI